MASKDCDGCGRRVRIAGGVDDLWTFDAETSKGLTLELTDGSEHFLCFDCVEELPDDRDPNADDVAVLAAPREDEEGIAGEDDAGPDEGPGADDETAGADAADGDAAGSDES